jgi:imidazolonepropionase
MEIAAAGGGINATVRATRQASKDELKALARPRLRRMLELGITTAEVKSGYGLETATEIKMLEAINELGREGPLEVVPTFLGAHEVPPEHRGQADRYIQVLVTEMIPEAASRRLARFNDVFCEQGVFSLEESEKVLNAGVFHGLRPKLHADELTPLGGAELAAEVKAVSADHLLFITDQGIEAMAKAGVVAVLLPGTAYFLSMGRYAPARRLIERGVPVALATDCNPGSCMTESLPLVLNMACTQMRLTPAEAIAAATINAAWAIGEAGRAGSLEPGKQADFLILDAPNHVHLCYHFGVNLVQAVFKRGRAGSAGPRTFPGERYAARSSLTRARTFATLSRVQMRSAALRACGFFMTRAAQSKNFSSRPSFPRGFSGMPRAASDRSRSTRPSFRVTFTMARARSNPRRSISSST